MKPAYLGHKSVRRNPLIADLYHRIGFIEKAGTGIQRMIEETRKFGYPEPEFKMDEFFTVTFTPSRTSEDDQHQDVTKRAPSGHQVGAKWALSGH